MKLIVCLGLAASLASAHAFGFGTGPTTGFGGGGSTGFGGGGMTGGTPTAAPGPILVPNCTSCFIYSIRCFLWRRMCVQAHESASAQACHERNIVGFALNNNRTCRSRSGLTRAHGRRGRHVRHEASYTAARLDPPAHGQVYRAPAHGPAHGRAHGRDVRSWVCPP